MSDLDIYSSTQQIIVDPFTQAVSTILAGPVGPPGPPGDGEVLWSDIAADALASNAETIAGAVTTKAVTPAGLHAAMPLRKYFTDAQWADATSGSPSLNHRDALQDAINDKASKGGGLVTCDRALKLNIQGTPLRIPSKVHLWLPGSTFYGEGDISAIETGVWDGSNTVPNNIPNDPSSYVIDGDDAVYGASIKGITFDGFDQTMRLHFFVWGSCVEYCDISGTTGSIHVSHSWGSGYRHNIIRSKMYVEYYVDWMQIEHNSFEYCPDIGLEIGPMSWTLSVQRNGFHGHRTGEGTAIKITSGVFNAKFIGNHFEGNIRHIYGSPIECRGMEISGNHFAAVPWNHDNTPVTAVEFEFLRNSTIGPNDFVTAGSATIDDFAYRIKLDTANCYGNDIQLETFVSDAGRPDMSKMSINPLNKVHSFAGINNPSLTQPSIVTWGGSEERTFEKYIAKYHHVNNQIPHCTLVRDGSTHTLTTHIAANAGGWVNQPCYVYIQIGGASNSYRIAGTIAGRLADVVWDARYNLGTGVAGPTVTLSVVGGFLVIEFTGVDNPSNMIGWVKAI